MITTDFSGTYDYEKEEAEHAAQYLLEEFQDGNITPDEFKARCEKEARHWEHVLGADTENFRDFMRYFSAALGAHHA